MSIALDNTASDAAADASRYTHRRTATADSEAATAAAEAAAEAAADAALLATPPDPLSPLVLFVCTYVGKFSNFHMDIHEASLRMGQSLGGNILAYNSNFGYACLPGHEKLMKLPAPPQPGKTRKGQGLQTCFHSDTEPVITLGENSIRIGKVYFTKLFPTGEAQVPGVLAEDLRDGLAVLNVMADFINRMGAGDRADGVPAEPWAQMRKAADEAAAAGDLAPRTEYLRRITEYASRPPPGVRHRVELEFGANSPDNRRHGPSMINYKFHAVMGDSRLLINLTHLSAYLYALERAGANASPATLAASLAAAGLGSVQPAAVFVRPPFLVRATNFPPIDDVKVSCQFTIPRPAPATANKMRVNVFPSGKVNFLGVSSVAAARSIYDFFIELFRANWHFFVCLQPRRDPTWVRQESVRRRAAEAPKVAPKAAPKAAPKVAPKVAAPHVKNVAAPSATDEDLDAILKSIFEI